MSKNKRKKRKSLNDFLFEYNNSLNFIREYYCKLMFDRSEDTLSNDELIQEVQLSNLSINTLTRKNIRERIYPLQIKYQN